MSSPWGGSQHEALAFPAGLLALEEQPSQELKAKTSHQKGQRQRKNRKVLLLLFGGYKQRGAAPPLPSIAACGIPLAVQEPQLRPNQDSWLLLC